MNRKNYAIAKGIIPAELRGKLLAFAKSKKHKWYSTFADQKSLDNFRRQVSVEVKGVIAELDAIVGRQAREINPQWCPRVYTILKSLPGGPRQAPHRDFTTQQIGCVAPIDLPGSAMICIHEPVSIATYGSGSYRPSMDNERILTIDPGDVLFFRGDLIHCGMAYTTTNIRIHCYLDRSGMESYYDTTEVLRFEEYYCKKCNKAFLTTKEHKKHEKTCKDCQCIVCLKDDFDGNEDTYTKHKKRKHLL